MGIILKQGNVAWIKTIWSWCRCLNNYQGQGYKTSRNLLYKGRYVYSSFLSLCLSLPTSVKASWSLATESNANGNGRFTNGMCKALPLILMNLKPSQSNPQSPADYSQETNHSFQQIQLRGGKIIQFQRSGESARVCNSRLLKKSFQKKKVLAIHLPCYHPTCKMSFHTYTWTDICVAAKSCSAQIDML